MEDAERVYATLGRKTLELEQLNAEYDRLLAVLAMVVTGEMPVQRVRVDLEGRCWEILAEASSNGVVYGIDELVRHEVEADIATMHNILIKRCGPSQEACDGEGRSDATSP